MIQANELRIGNYVHSILSKEKVDKVTRISTQKAKDGDFTIINVNNEEDSVLQEHLKPVPPTKEILLKCGFYFDEEYLYYALGRFMLDDEFNLLDIDINVQIKSIHHLQNLYFALIGEELEINF